MACVTAVLHRAPGRLLQAFPPASANLPPLSILVSHQNILSRFEFLLTDGITFPVLFSVMDGSLYELAGTYMLQSSDGPASARITDSWMTHPALYPDIMPPETISTGIHCLDSAMDTAGGVSAGT
jgi:hypothetical protein